MSSKPESKGAATAGEEEAASVKVAASTASGGIKPWLPLLANLIIMPIMAYVTAVYVLPSHLKASGASDVVKSESAAKAKSRTNSGEKKELTAKKPTIPLNDKVLVNLSGSAGTRYLLAKINLVGTGEKSAEDLKKLVEENNAALVDAAMNALRVKTVADLEKPGAMNLIRAQLISAFNDILGAGTVEGILLTEFAVQ